MRAWPLVLVACLVLPTVWAASPTDPRSYTWEETGVLAVGGGGLDAADVDYLKSAGFDAIANFRAEHQDPASYIRSKGMDFLYIPVDHAVNMNVSQLRQFVSWVEARRAEGDAVYAHCTHGWHRAAAFATAWEMKRTGLGYDAASDRVEARRAGTVMRAPAALLAYEAHLTGQPGLNVIMLSDSKHPPKGGTMPVKVEVLAMGKPVAGASVKVWSEEGGMWLTGKTGSDGRFTFTYKAPYASMDHLYARASYAGFVDGADNVELFFDSDPAGPGSPLSVQAWVRNGVVEAKVTKGGGALAAGTRVLATTSEGSHAFEVTATGHSTLRVPLDEGPVTVRVEQFGRAGARTTVTPGGSAQPEPAGEVAFEHKGGNEWWVEGKVAGPGVVKVEARDANSAWTPLTLRSWGSWAASFRVEPGNAVRYRATLADGRVVESCDFAHPAGGCTTGAAPPAGAFAATFRNVRGNEWWVETDVTVSGGTLAGVDARVDGGAWVALEKKSYGSWAKSIHAPAGSKVEFRARSTDGQSVASSPYAWPR